MATTKTSTRMTTLTVRLQNRLRASAADRSATSRLVPSPPPLTISYGLATDMRSKTYDDPRCFGVTVDADCSRVSSMFGRSRPAPVDLTTVTVIPWSGTTLRAEWSPFPFGRKRAVAPGVLLTSGSVTAQLHAAELAKLVEHRIGIAESIGSAPLAFLCWPSSAAPTSLAFDAVKDLPPESLAFLVDPMDGPAAAVVTEDELPGFTSWVVSLPH